MIHFTRWPVLILILSLSGVLHAQSTEDGPQSAPTFPPEWEPHQAVWIGFTEERDWPVRDHPARIEIIQALVEHVPVKVLVDTDAAASLLDSLATVAGIGRDAYQVVRHPVPNVALRDAGPIFLTDGEELTVADFGWNCYGHAPFCSDIDYRRGEVANDLAERYGWAVRSTDIVAEGGGLESSSTVLLAYEDFARSRNPGRSLEEIEDAYLRMYGKEKMIWITESPLIDQNGHKLGSYYGQGANGHIDAVMRFVNDSTVLVAVMDEAERKNSPLQDHDYEVFRAGLSQIRAARDPAGRPFHVVEIPVPDVSLHRHEFVLSKALQNAFPERFSRHVPGDTLQYVPVMSYANFLVTNGAVLVAEYWHEGLPESEKRKDERMKEVLATYFPDREIVGIRKTLLLNWNGGGIHCQTQQQPSLSAE